MYRPPTAETAAIMRALRDERHAKDLSWAAVAQLMEDDFGYRISEDQYRAAEQGITKRVTLDFLVTACRALDCDPAEILAKGVSDSGR